MGKKNWKIPFVNLKNRIQPLYEAKSQIHHAVLIAMRHRREEIRGVVDMLEPSCEGKRLACIVDMPTEGCKHHGHYFFGEYAVFQQFGRCLEGIEDWMRAIPKDLVPPFSIPTLGNQLHRNVVCWASLVYYLAWKLKTPYLEAELEYQPEAGQMGFCSWEECPRPPGADPREWLIHQARKAGGNTEWETSFSREDYRFPDVIDAFLIGAPIAGEFIEKSLAAIDCLVYILDQINDVTAWSKDEHEKRTTPKRSRSARVSQEIFFLKVFLAQHHAGGRCSKPLTAEQIAISLNWFAEGSKKPLTSKVTRRMQVIFGKDAMKTYVYCFATLPPRGFIKKMNDGSCDIEAFDY